MGFFDNLDLQSAFRVTKPFNSLRDIRWRAEQILKKKNLSREQLESAASGISNALSDYKEEKLAEEIERYTHHLYEHGGWELGFLEDFENDRQPGMDEIRALLENWPSWADGKPDIPTEENIYDLYALQDILISGYKYWDNNGFSCDTEAECYAVLALMKLDDVVGLLTVPERRNDQGVLIYPDQQPWKNNDLVDAGNLIVEAMEIVCFAERELSNEQLNNLRDEQKKRIDAERAAEKATQLNFSVLGKAGALKRHAPMRELESWAVAQYQAKSWPSANKAAHELKNSVMDYGSKIGATLTEENAQRTIAEWFRKSKRLSG